jgi:hypothetical protein
VCKPSLLTLPIITFTYLSKSLSPTYITSAVGRRVVGEKLTDGNRVFLIGDHLTIESPGKGETAKARACSLQRLSGVFCICYSNHNVSCLRIYSFNEFFNLRMLAKIIVTVVKLNRSNGLFMTH